MHMIENQNTATTRINQWILDKLRISPLDVNLLASTFETVHGKISKDWPFHVLKFWYKDDTIRIIPDQRRPTFPASQNSSMSTRHPDEASQSSELSQEHMRGSVHVLLAPPNQPPSILSDDTERVFALSRPSISSDSPRGKRHHTGPIST